MNVKPINQSTFINEEAQICPACAGEAVNWHDWEEDGIDARFFYECDNCHAKWTAVYHLAHYANLEVPDAAPQS